MSKPYRLITGLLLAALIAFSLPAGIVRAQCDGTIDSVECTGVDPDGWNARFVAPDVSTGITVQSGARVEGRITLDGGDTLIVEAGSALMVSQVGHSHAVIDNAQDNDSSRNTIINNGILTSTVTGIGHFVGVSVGINVNNDPAHVINNGIIAIDGVSVRGIYGNHDHTEIANHGHVIVEAKGWWPNVFASGLDVAGIDVRGNAARFINTGTVTVTGPVISGLDCEGDEMQTTNAGLVTAVAEHQSHGAVVAGEHSRFVNNGTISAKTTSSDYAHAHGIYILHNTVQLINTGTILAGAANPDSYASGVVILPGNVKVINLGLIMASGANSVGIASGGIRVAGNDRVGVLNIGTISGSTASINDTGYSIAVINRGTLNGDVIMGSSDDSFAAEGGAVNGVIDGGEGTDTLTLAFEVPEGDYPAVAAQIAAASPAGGSLTYGGATYTWVNFEKIVNRLNGIVHTPPNPEEIVTEATPDSGEVVEPVAPTPILGEIITNAPATGSGFIVAVPIAVCSSGDFADGRLNGLDLAATAIVYPYAAGGIDLYTPQGEWAVRAESGAIHTALAQAEASGAPVEIGARLGLALVAQPDGSLLATGPGYAFAFIPAECGIDG